MRRRRRGETMRRRQFRCLSWETQPCFVALPYQRPYNCLFGFAVKKKKTSRFLLATVPHAPQHYLFASKSTGLDDFKPLDLRDEAYVRWRCVLTDFTSSFQRRDKPIVFF